MPVEEYEKVRRTSANKIARQTEAYVSLLNKHQRNLAELVKLRGTLSERQAALGRSGAKVQLANKDYRDALNAALEEAARWENNYRSNYTKNAAVAAAVAAKKAAEEAHAQDKQRVLELTESLRRSEINARKWHDAYLKAVKSLERAKETYRTQNAKTYADKINALQVTVAEGEAAHQFLRSQLRAAQADALREGNSVDVLRAELRSLERVERAHMHDVRALASLRKSTGIEHGRTTVPVRDPASRGFRWARSVNHVSACIRGRGVDILSTAIQKAHGSKGFQQLLGTKACQPAVKAVINAAIDVQRQRWTDGKFGVYVQTMLDLSRRQYDLARHLCSDNYDEATDSYSTLTLWQNPHDPKDKIMCPKWAGRWLSEKERDRQFSSCDRHHAVHCILW